MEVGLVLDEEIFIAEAMRCCMISPKVKAKFGMNKVDHAKSQLSARIF